MSRDDSKAARQRLKDAREALGAHPATTEEDPEYLRLNQAVIDAERDVAWIFR
jgi:hypothetical protein